jgi:branched-chain amino acid aminotransferase
VVQLAADQGYSLKEQMIAREWLYTADELFFTGTAAEITPIRSVDGVQIGAGHRGPITESLQQAFFGITSGEQQDTYGWLTPVG